MNRTGLLVVISGFSGAGKGTLMRRLLEKYAQNYALSVSATTRKRREGERHGREYFFLQTDEFENMIEKEELIEYAKYVGNYYGTPKPYVLEKMQEGKDVILEIEVQGALDIQRRFPDAVMIFISAPNAESLKERLEGRGTEDARQIAGRLQRAEKEADAMQNYEYLVINDEIEDTVERIHALIQSQHCKMKLNREFTEGFKKDLEKGNREEK